LGSPASGLQGLPGSSSPALDGSGFGLGSEVPSPAQGLQEVRQSSVGRLDLDPQGGGQVSKSSTGLPVPFTSSQLPQRPPVSASELPQRLLNRGPAHSRNLSREDVPFAEVEDETLGGSGGDYGLGADMSEIADGGGISYDSAGHDSLDSLPSMGVGGGSGLMPDDAVLREVMLKAKKMAELDVSSEFGFDEDMLNGQAGKNIGAGGRSRKGSVLRGGLKGRKSSTGFIT
jgi:hypothetical protein